MVSIVAFQAVDPGSIPGHRRFFFFCPFFATRFSGQKWKEKKNNIVHKHRLTV